MTRVLLMLVVAASTACAGGKQGSAEEVVVYTSVDQVFSEPVFRAFEKAAASACARSTTPRRP